MSSHQPDYDEDTFNDGTISSDDDNVVTCEECCREFVVDYGETLAECPNCGGDCE